MSFGRSNVPERGVIRILTLPFTTSEASLCRTPRGGHHRKHWLFHFLERGLLLVECLCVFCATVSTVSGRWKSRIVRGHGKRSLQAAKPRSDSVYIIVPSLTQSAAALSRVATPAESRAVCDPTKVGHRAGPHGATPHICPGMALTLAFDQGGQPHSVRSSSPASTLALLKVLTGHSPSRLGVGYLHWIRVK